MTLQRLKISRRECKENIAGWLFILPVILGLCIFTAVPFFMSLGYSFTNYEVLREAEIKFIGLANYSRIFTDRDVLNSFGVTFLYTILSVSIGMVLSFLLAILLNMKIKCVKAFRVLLYIPVIIPAVAAAAIWRDMLNPTYVGTINRLLGMFGISPFPFFASEKTAMFSLILMSLWGVGGNMLMWIAGFNGVSPSFYEAAELDGANRLHKMFHITLPMVSPIVLYNLIMSFIGALQVFGSAFLLTGGGITGSTNFITLNIYTTGITKMFMGYAASQAWILFVIIMGLTVLIFKTSKWVYYGDEK